MKKLIASVLIGCFAAFGCYSSYTIDKEELKKLQAGNDAEYIVVNTEDGEAIEVSGGNALTVVTAEDDEYRITPFNFILSDTQLVSPDYDLLLPAEQVMEAEVRDISYGKTFGLIGGIVVATVGLFIAIDLFAGDEQDIGAR